MKHIPLEVEYKSYFDAVANGITNPVILHNRLMSVTEGKLFGGSIGQRMIKYQERVFSCKI